MTSVEEQNGSAGESHVVLPVPPVPNSDFFNETQWKVLYALMDTVVPAISPKGADNDRLGIDPKAYAEHMSKVQENIAHAPSNDEFAAYMSEKASDIPAFREHMSRTLKALPVAMRSQFDWILYLLSTTAGSIVLTGYRKPFHTLPAQTREAILQSWQKSRIQAIRKLAASITLLGKKLWTQTSPLFNSISEFPEVPTDCEFGKPAGYSFMQLPAAPAGDSTPITLETDVVIVGSGCGGGVVGKLLSEAGYRVLIVDKGYYFPPSALPMRSETAEINLFEGAGLMGSDDGSLSILAGNCWGGGGVVNYGVSLRTQDFVRKEWSQISGSSLFTSSEFDRCLDRVCDFMGVTDEYVRQNPRSAYMLAGAKKLGWDVKVTPHNSGRQDHYCGHCHLGCGSGRKQGPAVGWHVAAAKAGAQFLEGCEIERITFGEFSAGKKATGVVGKWTSRDSDGGLHGEGKVTRNVVVNAKRVVVSCGSLWSPVLLKKSGISNPNLGRNLYMHPVNVVTGIYKEDQKPWEGCAISSVVSELENLDNQGHGAKLEPTIMIPFTVLTSWPWTSGLSFKLAALKYRHFASYFALSRDRDTGYVYPDPDSGKPRVVYTPSAFDMNHVTEGIIGICRILYVEDAEEIQPHIPNIPPFIRSTSGSSKEAEDKRFEDWVKQLRKTGTSEEAAWASAHQMGSCRMGKSAETGVVDSQGRVFGTHGLHVADASVMPSAAGVNPMVSNMAISDWIARQIIEGLRTN